MHKLHRFLYRLFDLFSDFSTDKGTSSKPRQCLQLAAALDWLWDIHAFFLSFFSLHHTKYFCYNDECRQGGEAGCLLGLLKWKFYCH